MRRLPSFLAASLLMACTSAPTPAPVADASSPAPEPTHRLGAGMLIPQPGDAGYVLTSNGPTSIPGWQPPSLVGVYPIDGGGISNGTVNPIAISPGTAGQVFWTNDAGQSGWTQTIPATGGGLSYLVAQPKITTIGDSDTAGSNGTYSGMAGGWPTHFVQQMRQWRGDFEMVASQIQTLDRPTAGNALWNEGHSGYTLALIASGIPTWLAATPMNGPPDIDIVIAGADDAYSGRTLMQMETDWASVAASIWAGNPNAMILAMANPPFSVGTSVDAGTQSSTNTMLANFDAWLTGTWIPANASHAVHIPCRTALGSDVQADGIHPTQQGEADLGVCVATFVDQFMGVRRGPTQTWLSTFRYRQAWASYQVTTPASDGLTLTAHSGVNPGSGSFTIGFDFYPTSLPSGTYSLLDYGASGTNNYYQILYNSPNAVRVYWESGSGTIANTTGVLFSENALTLDTWNRIVVMADATHGVVGLYVNGRLAGINTAVSAWTNTQQTLYLGKDPNLGQGVPGYYGRLFAAKAVPGEPGGEAALRAVESDYYLGEGLVPGGATASFPLNGQLADDVYAPGNPNPSFVLVGGAASVAAWPGGTPLRPWESDGRQNPTTLYDNTGTAHVTTGTGAVVASGSAASSFTTTSGNTTVDSAGTLLLCNGTCTSVQSGNATNTLANEWVGHPLEGFVQSTQVVNLNAGAGDYVYLDTSQHTQLAPGSLKTTSGNMAVDSAAALTCGGTTATSVGIGNTSTTASVTINTAAATDTTTINSGALQAAKFGDLSGFPSIAAMYMAGGTQEVIACDGSATNYFNAPTTMAFQIGQSGMLSLNSTGLASTTWGVAQLGGTGGNNLAFGAAYVGASSSLGSTAGYEVFAPTAGAHNSQDGVRYHQTFEGRLSSYSAGNFNSYTLAAAHHGFSYECHVTGRVVTQGLGGGCAFWGSGQGSPDVMYRTNMDWSFYCTASNTCLEKGAGWYDSVDTTAAGTTQNGTAPTNPVIFFGGASVSGLTVTISWQYVTDSGGPCTGTIPVLDLVSDCTFVDN